MVRRSSEDQTYAENHFFLEKVKSSHRYDFRNKSAEDLHIKTLSFENLLNNFLKTYPKGLNFGPR